MASGGDKNVKAIAICEPYKAGSIFSLRCTFGGDGARVAQ